MECCPVPLASLFGSVTSVSNPACGTVLNLRAPMEDKACYFETALFSKPQKNLFEFLYYVLTWSMSILVKASSILMTNAS